MNGYFLEGSDGEFLMVIRSYDEETMWSIIKKLQSMRDPEIRLLADKLEKHFNDRHRGNPSKTKSEDKKPCNKGDRSRNFKATNPKHKPKYGP